MCVCVCVCVGQVRQDSEATIKDKDEEIKQLQVSHYSPCAKYCVSAYARYVGHVQYKAMVRY